MYMNTYYMNATFPPLSLTKRWQWGGEISFWLRYFSFLIYNYN